MVEAVLKYLPPDSLSLDTLGSTLTLPLLLHSLRTRWHEAGKLLQEDSEPPAEGWQCSVSACLSLCSRVAEIVHTLGLREARAGDPDGYCEAVRAPLAGVPLLPI